MAVKEAVEIVVIADRSGSMESIRTDAVGGFNSFLEEQQALKGKANLTLVLFDDKYEVPVLRVPVKKVPKLTLQTFVPRGTTAMNDAIGKALATLEELNPKKAVICIITDGWENASREFTTAQVKAKIQEAEAKGYQVQFLAANLDAYQASQSYGVSSAHTMAFNGANGPVGAQGPAGPQGQTILEALTVASSSVRSYRGQ
jgi:Mg-chelatase subunit ChlD